MRKSIKVSQLKKFYDYLQRSISGEKAHIKSMIPFFRNTVHDNGSPVFVKFFKKTIPAKKQGKRVIEWRDVPESIGSISRSFAKQLIFSNQAELYMPVLKGIK